MDPKCPVCGVVLATQALDLDHTAHRSAGCAKEDADGAISEADEDIVVTDKIVKQ